MLDIRILLNRISVTRFLAHIRTPLYRNGYALIMSSVLTSVFGIAYWLLAAHLYPTATVGTNSAAIAAMTFLSGVAGFYLDGTLVRFIPRAGQATFYLVGFTYLVTLTVAVIVSGIFLFGLRIWAPALAFLTKNSWLSIGFILATAMWCIFVEQDGVLTGLRQTMWVPAENAIYAVAKLVLLIIFSYSLPDYGILASWTIATLILIIPINFFLFRHLIPQHVQTTKDVAVPIVLGQIVKYAGGNYIGSLFYLAYSMLPPILVLQQAGSSASAYFYPPWMIASLLRLVTINMSTSLTVEGVVDQTMLIDYFRYSLISTARLIIPVVAIVMLAAPYLLRFFGASYATEGTILLRLLVLATIPNIVVVLYIGFLRVHNRIGFIIILHSLVAVLMLALSYILLHRYGITGIGIAWLTIQTALAMFLLLSQVRSILQSRNHTIQSNKMKEFVQ